MDITNADQFELNPINLPDEKCFFVIVGANNSGKSTFLRSVVNAYPNDAFRVDINRTVLNGEGSMDKNYQNNFESYRQQTNRAVDDNTQKPLQILQDFFQLKNKDRTPIIDWYNEYFPNRLYEEREDIDNNASPMLLKSNGFSITKQGSGMRATLEIFIKLFDPRIKILCIDEPELGLEPYLQKYLFGALKMKACQDKKIILATHSHHFLDMEEIDNNYVCKRTTNDKISLTIADDLKQIIFRLLGNSLSSFLLPERVLILEGPSDNIFLLKALRLIGKNGYSIHNSKGIGNISYAMQAIDQFLRFNDSHLSVYKEKLHVIIDKPENDKFLRGWERLVPNPETQICALKENGIEYYYPENLLQQIFKTEQSKKEIIDCYLKSKQNAKYNDVEISKIELSNKVTELLQLDDLNDGNNQLFVFIQGLPNP
jgi:predicted ATP-dependent endonuclease of OLD family